MSLNILLLCNKPNPGNDANTIVDHIDAIESYSTHHIWLYSNMGSLPKNLNLDKFDVLIIHYSLCILNNNYLSLAAKQKIRDYQGLKVIFIQDEYRQINKMISELSFLKVDVLFTCFPEQEINNLYPDDKLPGVSKFTNLTGYIPERLTKIKNQISINSRSIDVGYRGRKVPFWLGELGYEKWSIVDNWLKHAAVSNLKFDISYRENDRIYGSKWVEFLSSCKATLGVESGASVMDFTGDLEQAIDFHQLRYPNDSFHVVQKLYLSEHEGKYKLNQISPRCFEAISLKTVLVLYEGEYSGILVPNRHYIMLKKDFSNIEDVIDCLQNDEYLQNMANIAFEEIALNPLYSYSYFIKTVDKVINDEFESRKKVKQLSPYNKTDFERDNHIDFHLRLWMNTFQLYKKLPYGLRLIIKSICRPKFALNQFSQLFFRILNSNQNRR